MKIISSNDITKEVKKLCIDANLYLGKDVTDSIKSNIHKEENILGRDILNILLENANIAKEKSIPICQDTGMAVFFVKLGQEIYIEGSTIEEAINEGVRQGYEEGYLRKSVVHPITRVNTKDNTPAVIHYEIVKGDKLTIEFAPKGFRSENMSKLKMLKPSDGIDGIKNFIIDTVKEAGPNPCPPIVVGVGIGGTVMHQGIRVLFYKEKNMIEIKTPINSEEIRNLKCGDYVSLSGIIYTARDASHKS